MAHDLARELAELRRQIETVKRSVDRQTALPATPIAAGPLSHDSRETLARLTAVDFSQTLALELASAIENRQAGEADGGSFEMALRAECEQRLRFSPTLSAVNEQPKAMIFVGPAGAGKTTTLIKLALRYGLRSRLPLHLLSLDTLRIGGWEQLAAYARIAGIPCQPVHTPAALQQAFAEHAQKKLLFIDTPGFSPAEESQMRGMVGSFAAQRELLDVHLVLSAPMTSRTHLAALERFRAFAPSKLLFTHLDEVESPGPLLETALRAGLPLSFLAKGQQVPEDIDEASLDRILGSLAAVAPVSRRIASAA